MSKHTPGPWAIGFGDKTGRYVEAEHDGYVAIVPYWSRPEEEKEANARLIAAAPELLDACQASANGVKGWQDMMHAAIAKATGDKS